MLSDLKSSPVYVGIKQSVRALEHDRVSKAFIASDADEKLTQPVKNLCDERGVTVEYIGSMHELGKACGIDIGAAVAVVLKG